jgi:Fe-S cluster assembly scaffold protein SufB
MYPLSYVKDNATVRYSTIVVAKEGSNIDVGSRAYLEGKGAKTEMISRGISTGGNAYLRGDIVGKAEGVKGHLECRGLILGEKGMIYSVPELTATLNDVDLSHEAAIGKIAEEEIFYLMSRGLSEEEATSVIVRGFLSVDIKGLPPALDAEIKRIIDSSIGSL